MKKLIVFAILNLSVLSAFAGQKIVCVDKRFQDATFSANFELKNPTSTVDLFIPDGETSGVTVSGECQRDAGAIELAMTCNVMTSTDSGYEVRLFSIGGSTLSASVTPWSMAGKGQSIPLPCDN